MSTDVPKNLQTLQAFLDARPTMTDGDKRTLTGFALGLKPASHLPKGLSPDEIGEISRILKEHIPDSELRLLRESPPLYLIYSPQAIRNRVQKDTNTAEWLGIQADRPEEILEKMAGNTQIEGFVLGFPEAALRTWQRLEEIQTKAPSFNQLSKAEDIFDDWDPDDVAKLRLLRRRRSRVPGTFLADFYRLPNVRPLIEELYRKYTPLTQEEIDFLFSVHRIVAEHMVYVTSSLIEDQTEGTRSQAMDAIG